MAEATGPATYDDLGTLDLSGGSGGADTTQSLEDWGYHGYYKQDRLIDGQTYYIFETGVGSATGRGKHKFHIAHYNPDTQTYTRIKEIVAGGIMDHYDGSAGKWFDAVIPDLKHQFTSPDWVEGQVAKDINYSDISRFFDPITGNVQDQDGLAAYLQQLPTFAGRSKESIKNMFSSLPNIKITPGEYSEAMGERASDIYGLHSGMKTERAGEEHLQGISGVYSPTDTGFGTGTSAYGELGKIATQEGGDIYGLQSDVTQEFVDWIETQA